jgi:hypothetical protein
MWRAADGHRLPAGLQHAGLEGNDRYAEYGDDEADTESQ